MTEAKLPTKQKMLFVIQTARCSLYLLVSLLAVLQHVMQPSFYNWDLMRLFYVVVVLGLGYHLPSLLSRNKIWISKQYLSVGIVLDVVLISSLLHFSILNQALFLFLYLIVIIISGLLFSRNGALLTACLISISFSFISILGPELKAMNFVFLLLVNNLTFFIVAGLAGYLSQQFQIFETELTAKNLSIAKIRQLNEIMVESLPVGLLSISAKGEVLTGNPASHMVLGTENVVGAYIHELIPSVDEKFWQELHTDKKEIKYSRDTGDRILLGVQKIVVQEEDTELNTWMLLLEDLTELKRLEAAVRQSEKMAAVGQLAAGIAHEIRNPLAGISGSIELLSQTSNNEDDQKLTRIILKEISRLNNLISEFLDFAKPESPPVDKVNLVSLMNSVGSHVKSQFPTVDMQFNLQNTILVRGHEDKLRQAFLNILINAAQAVEKKEQPKIEVTGTQEGAVAILRIRDNGYGIKPETLKRMFEPFHTTKPKGTGLGLAITHKILESHQAQVQVESTVDVGTEFLIRFPEAQPSS